MALTSLALHGLVLAGGLSVLAAGAPSSGWEAFAAGHYEQAVTAWSQAALAGDPQAEFGLGLAYDLGRGVEQNEKRACDWYNRAGGSGVSAASFNMGVMFDQGRCGPRDAAKAAAWYARAAAAGHARAQYNLAQLYEAGDGVPRNIDEAIAWYQLAGAKGLSAATQRIATLRQRERPPPPDGLQHVEPIVPAAEALPDRAQPIPFVWLVPAQPGPVRFVLELDSVNGKDVHEVTAENAEQSAVQITLPPGDGNYAWRVFTVAARGLHYAVSDWHRFKIIGRTIQ